MQALVAGVKGAILQHGLLLHAARLVPLAQQHVHRLAVQLGAPVGQLDPVAVHQGDHGQHQGVDRQVAHALVGPDRGQQLPRLLLRP